MGKGGFHRWLIRSGDVEDESRSGAVVDGVKSVSEVGARQVVDETLKRSENMVVKSYKGSHLAEDDGLHQSSLYIVFLPSFKGGFRECDFSRTKYPLFVEILDDGLHQSAIYLAQERTFKTLFMNNIRCADRLCKLWETNDAS
ncbi:hypothetical protein Tco_0404052 [Tanacetum coccineum]